MKFNEFLKDVIKKTDIDITNPDTAAMLGASALKEIEVPDMFVSQFYKGIYTKEAAMNDPEIKSKYLSASKGEVFNDIDRAINKVFRELGFGDDFIAEINKKSLHDNGEHVDTRKKLQGFGEKIKEMLDKSKSTPPIDAKKTDEEVRKVQEDLNNQIKALVESHKLELSNIQNQAKNDKITGTLRGKILSYNFIDMKEENKIDVANAKIAKILNSYHIEPNETGGLDIRDKKDPSLDVYDAKRNKLSIDELLNSELSDFVKKSDTPRNPDAPKPPSPFSVQPKATSLVDIGAQKARTAAEVELAKMLAS
jgi:hypothetical protein